MTAPTNRSLNFARPYAAGVAITSVTMTVPTAMRRLVSMLPSWSLIAWR